MPSGRGISLPEVALNHAGSVTHLDDVTSYVERGVVDPWLLRRAPASVGVPDVLDQAVSGRRWRLWDSVLFGIIHVIPRARNLGAVISQTSFQAEVWNADELAHQCVGTTVVGASGVSVAGGITLPGWWAPFSSVFFTIQVDGQGDPIIDTLVTWLFPGFTGTDCHVLGFRIVLLPLAAEMGGALEESLDYAASVRRAEDGSEQRRQLGGRPTRDFGYQLVAMSAREAAETRVKLFTAGRYLFGLPYWPDAAPLTADVTPGALSIPCDTTTRIFEAGGLVLLWRDSAQWEVLTAESVSASAIVPTAAVAGSWPAAATYVIPVLPARLTAAMEDSQPTVGLAEFQGRFATEPT